MPEHLCSAERAALRLLEYLDARGYDFVTITPASHRRVIARSETGRATNLRGIFGWSLPFELAVAGDELVRLLRDAEMLAETEAGLKATVRVSRARGRLFLHSAFPTNAEDSVFLGPDTLRFLNFIESALPTRQVRRLVDIGAGAGVGGIIAATMLGATPRVELADINRRALGLAQINAVHAGVEVHAIESNAVDAVAPGFDLAIANPPFIIDDGGPAYRSGGSMHGAELSLRWCLDAAAKLGDGGCILLYTGSAIVEGQDALYSALRHELPDLSCTMEWRELDPDIFGEELDKPAYRNVERIAAVGTKIVKAQA